MSIIIGNREILLGEILDLAAEKLATHGGWSNYRFVDTSIFEILSFSPLYIKRETYEIKINRLEKKAARQESGAWTRA